MIQKPILPKAFKLIPYRNTKRGILPMARQSLVLLPNTEALISECELGEVRSLPDERANEKNKITLLVIETFVKR